MDSLRLMWTATTVHRLPERFGGMSGRTPFPAVELLLILFAHDGFS